MISDNHFWLLLTRFGSKTRFFFTFFYDFIQPVVAMVCFPRNVRLLFFTSCSFYLTKILLIRPLSNISSFFGSYYWARSRHVGLLSDVRYRLFILRLAQPCKWIWFCKQAILNNGTLGSMRFTLIFTSLDSTKTIMHSRSIHSRSKTV